ncbi:bifunctional 3,4-dihydroxy-2-butanone-4-phosphate synthase/GTP cyclohydrolase II [Pseudonocardia hispaniensis]|uniref:Riboflavin biosynthesis protein RibBA n=1 Tax=Pseudonocardia hispaniensis TaxID=904933 RepID=A0ABW1J877_9PSEU
MTSIGDAVQHLRDGGIVVVTDDEDRENEGDLIMAAQHATTDDVAFFLEHTSGFLCTAITGERAQQLELSPIAEDNTEVQRTAFLTSVDYARGTTTGISAHDRAATIRALADVDIGPQEFVRPGHVLPLRARRGGVLKRAGHTEAAVDLCRMAGLSPAGLLCELVTPDRRGMMRRPDIERFVKAHDLPLISTESLVRHRRITSHLVERTGEADIATEYGVCHAVAYRSTVDDAEHLALVFGAVADGRDVLVRVHSECLTGDVMASLRCDCGPQLQAAMQRISVIGRGVVIYLRGQEGRGIGLGHKLRAYELQQRGRDTVDANLELGLPVDSREYGVGAQMLADLGVRRVVLMTNNPHKYGGLAGYGVEVVSRVALRTAVTEHNVAYLTAKSKRLGHDFDLPLGMSS